MKKNFAATAPLMAFALGVTGCVQQDEDFTPKRQAGFRPPPVPLTQEALPPVDPQGTQAPTPAPTSPLPDPASSAGTPDGAQGRLAQKQGGDPAPTNTPAPEPPKQQKPAPPQYAKKVPGKPNQIFNPYTGAVLDVTGLTPGTEVRDPRTGQTMLVP